MTDEPNLEDYTPPKWDDPFGDIIDLLGPMTHVTPVSREEADRYRGKLPNGLLDFWVEHGRGALLNGYGWITDPGMFQPVLSAMFEGNTEYEANDFSAYYYTYDGVFSA